MNCDFFLSFCLSELQDDLCSDLSNLQNWLSRNFVSPLFPCPSKLFLLLLLSQFDHRDTRKKARKLPCKSWGELKTYVRRGDEKIAVSNFSNLHRMQSLQIHFLGPKIGWKQVKSIQLTLTHTGFGMQRVLDAAEPEVG